MRRIPAEVQRVITEKMQTEGNRAKITNILKVKRQETLLKNNYFLETLQFDLSNALITDMDIAVAHPYPKQSNEEIYITVVNNGNAKLYVAEQSYKMNKHIFVDNGFSIPAIAVAVGFDTVLEPAYLKGLERVTSRYPWWFYVTEDGSLIGRDLNNEYEEFILARENVSDVACVSGIWDSSESYNYGMMVFYISNGRLMVKRLINDIWYNSQVISFGPSQSYTSVTATLTWDYRIVLTVTDAGGNIYSLYTTYLAFGKMAKETIDPSITMDIDASKIRGVQNFIYDTMSVSGVSQKFDFLYKGPALALYAENVMYGNNPGRVVRVWFNTFMRTNELFITQCVRLTDGNLEEIATTCLVPSSERYIDFYFDWFNDFEGPITISFVTGRPPGKILNEFMLPTPAFTLTFTPDDLTGLPRFRNTETVAIKSVNANINTTKVEKLYPTPAETIRPLVQIAQKMTNIKDI